MSLESTYKLQDEVMAQWKNGLFYKAKVIRVLKETGQPIRYVVTTQDKPDDNSAVVTSDQVRDMGDRPVVRVSGRVEEKVAQEICSKALKEAGIVIPESAANYTGSLCIELVNDDRCLDVESWFFRLSPLLLKGLLVDEVKVWKACNNLIKKLVPLVGSKDGDKRRLSSEVFGKDDNVLLNVNKLTLGYMGKILLIRTRMRLLKGHRYGIVGENGAGKTTLMRKIASGELPGFPKWIKTVYVQPDFDPENDYTTAYDYLRNAQLEEQGPDSDPAVLFSLMNDLHFTEKLRNSIIKELSGGWKMRVSLARASMMRADILLLDEPTNHLDVSAVKWLETYLRSVPNTVMVISHEPPFLDRVATDIIFMKGQKLNPYVGNFTEFTKQQQGFSASDLEDSAMSGPTDALRFRFPDPGELLGITSRSRAVMTMKNIFFAYDPKRGNVLKGVKGKLTLSSRIAVVGPNGAGKSTMVKLLVGELEPTTGDIWRHLNLRISYVAQHSFDHLEKVKTKPALAYIRQRFIRGFDSENSAYHHSAEDIHTATDSQEIMGRSVEQILGRRKFKNSVAYEVKWEGYPESENTWETEMRLRELGVAHLARQVDEKIRSKKSGTDQRPLTNKEIIRHLGDFGLDKQYANAKIEGLSGGQKCKLVLAGAMWNKPHMLVLDEPTNYLDLDALQALAKAINRYKGGIIMVSHNQDFISEICTEQWNMCDGVFDAVEVKKPEKVDEEALGPGSSGEDKGYDGRHAAAAKAAESKSDLPAGLGKLLGPTGVLSEKAAVRKEALSELQARQAKNNFGGQEGRDRVFRVCLSLLKEQDDELWTMALELGKAIAHSVSPRNVNINEEGDEDEDEDDEAALAQAVGKERAAEAKQQDSTSKAAGALALLDNIREYSLTLKQNADSFMSEANGAQAEVAQKFAADYHVGERVEARYPSDNRWYAADVLKVLPRGQGFKINYIEYSEEAKLPVEDVRKVVQKAAAAVNRKLKAPVSEKAKAASAQSALENRARAGVLVIKAALVSGLPVPEYKAEVAGTAMEIVGALTTANTAGNMSANKATSAAMSVQLHMEYALTEILVAKRARLGLDRKQLLQNALDALIAANQTNVQIGAAHALAGLAAGFGIDIVREFALMDKLLAMGGKTSTDEEKAAVLVAFPQLARALGNVFEYNVVEFLPILLTALKTRNKAMGDKATNASRALMACLSIHGARLVLPYLLAGLDSKDWKDKVTSTQVLESVSYCSEALMSAQLPNIVPKLMEVMANPRNEVRMAAESAFDQIGSVIANPEIKPLVPALMDAVRDPTKGTAIALEKLTHTSFAHAVDSPSLAILMPIVFNGMKDRKLECKKAAMKVVAALCALIVDIKFLAPYADELLVKLTGFLFYSMPDVRDIAAKALGTLFHEMGEDYFPDLMDFLVDSLKGDDVSPHQIAGAAKGLCYCTHALGVAKTTDLMPMLLKQCKSEFPNVRAGHYELFVVMPEVFGDVFRFNFLVPVLPIVLEGVADPVLMAQEAAVHASQELVSRHARSDTSFVLGFIMDGLKHKDPKVRTGFLQLMGTLFLNLVVDTNFSQTVKFWGHGNSLEEDEIANEATKEQQEIIKQYLGEIIFNEAFSELYLMRSDSSDGVAQMAWRVWMLIIPRERDLLETLLDILVERIVENLSSKDDSQKKKGRTALGILVKSMGDRGLARIMPLLYVKLNSEDANVRKAVCLGFSQVMLSAGKGDIGAYLNDIVPAIRDMLCDSVPMVRNSAGNAFAQLYKNVGGKAIDKIVPFFLATLLEGKHQEALVDGVTCVLEKCDMHGYFNLLGRLLSKCKPVTDPGCVDFLMREYLMGQLADRTKTGEGMELVRTFKALQRHAEEQYELSISYLPSFAADVVSRVMDQRGNIRMASRQCLFHVFGWHVDAEKAEKDLRAFCHETKPAEVDELIGHMKTTTPETEVKDVAIEETKAETEEEKPAEDGDAAGEPAEKLNKDEKRCAKCQKVRKLKSYSKKQFMKKDGLCKTCS